MNRPLRVLSLATLFPGAARPGFGRFVERQANAVAARADIDLTVVNPLAIAPAPLSRFFHSAKELAAPVEDASRGYAVHRPRFARLPLIGPRLNPWLIAKAVLPLAHRLHGAAPFDLVDAQFFYPDGPAAARIAESLGLSLTIKARGSDIHYWGTIASARQAMLDAAGRATRLLTVSEALGADMAALGMDPAKITVHYTGLDHSTFRLRDKQEARRELASLPAPATAVPNDMKLVVTTGNLIPLKGQALVIRALAQLPDTRLLLAGSGPDRPALETLAAELGLADRVHFGTYAPADLAVALAGADAMALPSEREGLANAWIEAMACGAPLVITDVGGAREVVRSPAAGHLVERSPAAIAERLRQIFDAPPVRSETAAAAARFSWESNAAQLAAIWHEVAG